MGTPSGSGRPPATSRSRSVLERRQASRCPGARPGPKRCGTCICSASPNPSVARPIEGRPTRYPHATGRRLMRRPYRNPCPLPAWPLTGSSARIRRASSSCRFRGGRDFQSRGGTGFEPATPRSNVWCSAIELASSDAAFLEPVHGTRPSHPGSSGCRPPHPEPDAPPARRYQPSLDFRKNAHKALTGPRCCPTPIAAGVPESDLECRRRFK